MLVNLKTAVNKASPESVILELRERLPAHINSGCIVNCQFAVESQNNYFILTLKVNSDLIITCQRCLKEFIYHYVNETKLAVCHSDEMAEKLMDQYECVIAENNHIDLAELITDEFHLYTPELHPETNDCDTEINRFIGADDTIK
ncbi:YceD family protein [Legionella hackeliae]|uniref:Large ribosomal RNA subunit accumulation protein YceD n=1 Tax=Legionella hackeliae TaxID=449 RepID=A0A0A8UPY3_LEGHA|nr:YceD family protein [Legionella hackeliae]KTD09851.1 metal-binding protein [Legionella hackeliae]CEK10818.1 conserved protein of unknown function [Legionella hackeliae]STX47555.1 metal-binding, possibly nucleic acid-binding protein [Legionella hackeliae]